MKASEAFVLPVTQVLLDSLVVLVDLLGGTALIKVIAGSGRVLDCLRQTGEGQRQHHEEHGREKAPLTAATQD